MSNTYKCLICLDSGYLAINRQNKEDVVPMLELTGSELADYGLEKCSCQVKSVGEKMEESADAIKKRRNKCK